jgi:hypothetical protein
MLCPIIFFVERWNLVRITTDRPPQRRDPFDRLAHAALRLPGARRLGQTLDRRDKTRRWVWFLTIYVVSVVVFGAVALFLNAIVPK